VNFFQPRYKLPSVRENLLNNREGEEGIYAEEGTSEDTETDSLNG
jgi:hypothetical protein